MRAIRRDGTKVTDQAVTADGRYVTVLGSGAGARIFYGTSDHMTEGHITGANAGCFQSYDFEVGPTAYTVYFGYPVCAGMVGTRLYRDGALPPEQMTLVTASNPTFYCF